MLISPRTNQLPGATEALRINPVHYSLEAFTEDNIAYLESTVGLLGLLRSNAHLRKKCEVKYINKNRSLTLQNTQDYVWHELEELPLTHQGLIFAQNSSLAEPFAEIIAERQQAYLRTYEEATALSKKCAEHFFPKTETKVSQKQQLEAGSLDKSAKPL